MTVKTAKSRAGAFRLLLGVALLAAVGGMAAWMVTGMETTPPGPRADPDDPQQVSRGQALYGQYCAACHGADLEGQPDWRRRKPDGRLPAPPHDETGHTWHHPDAVLFNITKSGLVPPLAPEGYESDMPAFGEVLTDAQIWDILAFIKSTWPADIQRQQTAINGR